MVTTSSEHRYDNIDEAIADVTYTDLSVEIVRDSYSRLIMSQEGQIGLFRSFYEELTRYPAAARHFPKQRFGELGKNHEPSKGWKRQFQALKEAVLLLIVFKAFREEGREPNILTRIVEEHAKRKIPPALYGIFENVLIDIVLKNDPEARSREGELKEAWTSVIHPGIEYMSRRTVELDQVRMRLDRLGSAKTGTP
jgi:hypothetical protein